MALDLTPNPVVIATQIGIFSATILVVKKMFLEPYLKLRTNRLALTKGSETDALKLIQENESLGEKISSRKKEFLANSSVAQEQLLGEAQKNISAQLDAALQAQKSAIASYQADVEKQYEDMAKEVDSSASQLAQGIIKKWTNKS